ncbi:hypothetical protein [Thermofilum pendens]|nr:hypothetical protein [Thermofilum pendens]
MHSSMLLGVAGMLLIIAAWIASFKDVPSPRLSSLYAAGSFLLAVHSVLIGDPVFLVLNSLATALALLNLYRWYRGRAKP